MDELFSPPAYAEETWESRRALPLFDRLELLGLARTGINDTLGRIFKVDNEESMLLGELGLSFI